MLRFSRWRGVSRVLGCGYGLLGGACGARPRSYACEPSCNQGLARGGPWEGGGGAGSASVSGRKTADLRIYFFMLLFHPFGLRLQTGGPRPSVAHRYVLIGLCCA